MNTFEYGTIKRKFASSWDELSRRQLLFIARMFNRKVNINEFKVRVLFRLLSLKWKVFKGIREDDVYFCGETLNFLLEKVALTRNLINSIRIFPFFKYIGPADKMKHSTFGEFINIHVRYEQYCDKKDDHLLSEIIACMYRRKKLFWWARRRYSRSEDPRVRFSDKTIARRAGRIKKLNQDSRLAIYFFVVGTFNAIPSLFPNVYRRRSGSSTGGWPSLVISLADGKTDDENLDRVMNSNMYNVLLGLEQKAKEYHEFLEKTKQKDD